MDSKELRGLYEAYSEVYAPQEVDEAKQESDEEDWRKSEIRNLRRHRQTGTTTPYRDRLVSHTKGRGVKKERGSKVRTEEVEQIDEIKTSSTTSGDRIPDFENNTKAKQVPGLRVNKPQKPVEEGYKSPNKKRIQIQSDAAYKKERSALDRGDSDEAMRQNRRRNAMNTPATRRNELESKNRKEEFDIFDTILEHLIAEGYADTNEAAIAIMANMSEEWRDSILSEEPVQDYRDMVRAKSSQGSKPIGGTAAQNPQPRSREFSRVVATPKGPKSPGSAAIKLQPRGREFTNPPS